MQNIDNIRRRTFLKTLVAGAAVGTLGFPMLGKAANQRIVVIGGGTGGATVAKYLRRLLICRALILNPKADA